MKIFLDDIREPQDCLFYMNRRIGSLNTIYLEDWIVVRNYDEFVNTITNNIDKITHVSFDHDLADEHYDPKMLDTENYNQLYDSFNEKTGYDCAKWLKEYYQESNKELPVMFVHSMNPTGTNNIVNLFKNK